MPPYRVPNTRISHAKLLTQIMLYLAPSSFVTATWMYRGKRLEGSGKFPPGTYIQVPTGFAAWEQPTLLLADLRDFIATVTR